MFRHKVAVAERLMRDVCPAPMCRLPRLELSELKTTRPKACVVAAHPVSYTFKSSRASRVRRALQRDERDGLRRAAVKRSGVGAVGRAVSRIAFGLALMAGALLVSLDAIATRLPSPTVQEAIASKTPLVKVSNWTLDLDGDGVADLANPTHNAIRGEDAYGSGKFGARRDKGKRKHEGADFVVAPGGAVWSPLNGVVTAIGYAYQGDENLRFVEVKDLTRRLSARIFYIEPSVKVGDTLIAGDALGVAESLGARYPHGITNHVHVELRDARGVTIDPATTLPVATDAIQLAALDATPPSPIKAIRARAS